MVLLHRHKRILRLLAFIHYHENISGMEIVRQIPDSHNFAIFAI